MLIKTGLLHRVRVCSVAQSLTILIDGRDKYEVDPTMLRQYNNTVSRATICFCNHNALHVY